MHAGRLRHRVHLQRAADQQATSPYGEMAAQWETVATLWAEVADLTGRELEVVPVAQGDVRVRIRYRPGVTPAMRLVLGDRILDIVRVADPDGRRRELVLYCREAIPQ